MTTDFYIGVFLGVFIGALLVTIVVSIFEPREECPKDRAPMYKFNEREVKQEIKKQWGDIIRRNKVDEVMRSKKDEDIALADVLEDA